MLCVAPTGSGKTYAIILPILALRSRWPEPEAEARPAARALYLVPTRELAMQVAVACEPMGGRFGMRVAAVYGGESQAAQRVAAARACLLVATPGRLLDLIGLQPQQPASAHGRAGSGGSDGAGRVPNEPLSMAGVLYIALDEADKMLSMGLRAQVEAICGTVPSPRQLVMATATGTEELIALSASLQREPVSIAYGGAKEQRALSAPVRKDPVAIASGGQAAAASGVGGRAACGDDSKAGTAADASGCSQAGSSCCGGGGDGDAGAALAPLPTVPASIRQRVWVVAEHKKPRRLLRLMDSLHGAAKDGGRTLVFANTAKRVLFVCSLLTRHGQRAAALIGSMPQADRSAVLAAFRSGETPVLVATDVAARGLHIEGLRHVVCWDAGTNLEQYVHRVGRCGRGGEQGQSFCFFARKLRPLAPAMVRLLCESGQEVEPYLRSLAQEDTGADAGAVRGRVATGGDGEGGEGEGGEGEGGDREEVDRFDVQASAWLLRKMASPITGKTPTFALDGFGAPGKQRKAKRRRTDRGAAGQAV